MRLHKADLRSDLVPLDRPFDGTDGDLDGEPASEAGSSKGRGVDAAPPQPATNRPGAVGYDPPHPTRAGADALDRDRRLDRRGATDQVVDVRVAGEQALDQHELFLGGGGATLFDDLDVGACETVADAGGEVFLYKLAEEDLFILQSDDRGQ